MAEAVAGSQNSETLGGELWATFLQARSSRQLLGATEDIRRGAVRQAYTQLENQMSVTMPEGVAEQMECGCAETESCGACELPLDSTCIKDTLDGCESAGIFEGLAALLTNVKMYEFTASAEKAYAAIGNHPHQLKATKTLDVPQDKMEEAAEGFFEFLEALLAENPVPVDDIAQAFNMETLSEVSDHLINVVKHETDIATEKSLRDHEVIIQRIFQRANFMHEYMEVLRDTTEYPLGIMWCDDQVLKKSKKVTGGKLTVTYDIQASAERVDPKYFWATEDWKLEKEGTMCFRLKCMSKGDLSRVAQHAETPEIGANIAEFLEANPDGHRMYGTSLFTDDITAPLKGRYDVLVARGMFSSDALSAAHVDHDSSIDNYHRAEVWYAGGKVLYVRVLPEVMDDFGVYTTVFRRKTDHIWGIALHEFVYPFAKMYEGSIKALDASVGKAVGSIISLDSGVLEDPDQFLPKGADGNYQIDLAGDTIIQFDSTAAAMSPNFKGVPLHIQQLPNDINKIIPVLGIIFQQLEIITGIPAIVASGAPSSSALRTESLYNQAFEAAAKPIQAILRGSEQRILEKAVQFFFTAKAASGELSGDLLSVEPEVLLSDELTREFNDDQRMLKTLGALQPYIGIIPEDKIASLLNEIGRELGLDDELVPEANPLSGTPQAQPTQAV